MNKTKIHKNKKRLFKRTKKHRKQYSGGGSNSVITDKITDLASSAGQYIGDKVLRLAGLERIPTQTHNVKNADAVVVTDVPKSEEAAIQSVGQDIANVSNKVSGSIIENVNEVLGSPQLDIGVSEAVENTKEIISDKMEELNNIVNDPIFEQKAEKTLDNVAKYSEIAVEALDKPLDKAVDKLNDAGTKMLSGAVSGSIKVGTDAMAAVPGLGAIVEAGKIVNDISNTASTIVQAGSEATNTISTLFEETSDNIKKLEELKEAKNQISNRTSESIQNFLEPTTNYSLPPQPPRPIIKGGTKKATKYKCSTKRVRFAV